LVAELGLRDGEPVLLTLSRISPEKGLERVIEALRLGEHRDEVPTGLRLLIAGEAAFMQGQRYRAELVRRAATLTQARIEFVGYASGARKAALLDLADLFIFPSRHESYGLTLAEALQAGRPVISTAHYSARELVQDAGIVVPNVPEGWVPEALWAAIRRMLGDPGLRRTMAAAAGRRAAGLSFDRAASRIARLARSLAERRPDRQAGRDREVRAATSRPRSVREPHRPHVAEAQPERLERIGRVDLAAVLLHDQPLGVGVGRNLVDQRPVEVALAHRRELLLATDHRHVLVVQQRAAPRDLLNPLGRIAATGLDPVGVDLEADVVGGLFEHDQQPRPLTVALQFMVVVVVAEAQPVRLQRGRRGGALPGALLVAFGVWSPGRPPMPTCLQP